MPFLIGVLSYRKLLATNISNIDNESRHHLLTECDIEIYRDFGMQYKTTHLLGLFVEYPQ